MTVEPKPRKNGRCLVCDKPRPIVKPQRGVPASAYVDAFCSSRCARAWFGTDLPPTAYVDPDEVA